MAADPDWRPYRERKHKVDPEKARIIRQLRAKGFTYGDISKRYNISTVMVYDICYRRKVCSATKLPTLREAFKARGLDIDGPRRIRRDPP